MLERNASERLQAPGGQQAVIRWSSGGNQAVIRRSSCGHPVVINRYLEAEDIKQSDISVISRRYLGCTSKPKISSSPIVLLTSLLPSALRAAVVSFTREISQSKSAPIIIRLII